MTPYWQVLDRLFSFFRQSVRCYTNKWKIHKALMRWKLFIEWWKWIELWMIGMKLYEMDAVQEEILNTKFSSFLIWFRFANSQQKWDAHNLRALVCKIVVHLVPEKLYVWPQIIRLIRVAEIVGLPPRLTSFRIISYDNICSAKRTKFLQIRSFWYKNAIFSSFWSILGPIWSFF